MTSQTEEGRHLSAILQGLLVAFLWATSWVLIKFGLIEIPPLVFAGIRYFLAFLLLLLVSGLRSRGRAPTSFSRRIWPRLALLGILLYTLAQGAMFVALDQLSAVTVNLALNFTTLAVAISSVAWLGEKQSWLQWLGIGIALVGAILYFYPGESPGARMVGLLAATVCVIANALAVLIGRDVNRSHLYPPLQVTVASMGVGSVALLAVGLVLEGLPSISPRNWIFISWLAAVNTAFAFTIWNHTLRTLSATESSIINGTMLIWIPILALLYLGEEITTREMVGLAAAGAGTLLVQLRIPGGP